MEPVEVDGGRAAIEAIAKANHEGRPFSLALIDFMMPEMDGCQLIERINQDPALAMGKILLLTSGAESSASRRGSDLKISSCMFKPIKQTQLLNAITGTLRRGRAIPPESSSPRSHAVVERAKNLQVLLAEDNVINQKLVVRLLEKAGHSVTVASDGRKALVALEANEFDLVLMDIQMPEMSGFEATQLIREKEKSTQRHIPIIALTAHAMKGDREKCLQMGMDAYLTKPLRREELFEALTRFACPASDQSVPPSNDEKESSKVDTEALMNRLGDDRALLRELTSLFADDSLRLMGQVQSALQDQSPERLEKAAHTLKGALGSLFANAAFDLAFKLHEAARSRDLARAAAVFQRLEKEIEIVRETLKSLVESRDS